MAPTNDDDAAALQTLIAQAAARIANATRENAALVVRQKAEGAAFSRRANAEIERIQAETKRLKVQEHKSNGPKAKKKTSRAASGTADCVGRSPDSVPRSVHKSKSAAVDTAANTDIRLSRGTALSLFLVTIAVVVVPVCMFVPQPSASVDEINRLQGLLDEKQRVQCRLMEELAGLQPRKTVSNELTGCRAVTVNAQNQLWAAIEAGSVEEARKLLGQGIADPSAPAPEQKSSLVSPLHYAAATGRAGIVQVLLEHKVDPNDTHPTGDGDAPLYIAAQNGHRNVVKMLLEHNADPNQARTSDGATPIYIAAQHGHRDVAKVLLERNADPNTLLAIDASTPLYIAAQNGHSSVLELLLEHKADPNKATLNIGATPLFIAAQKGHVDALKLLLEHKADPNQARINDGATPLYVAVQMKFFEGVVVLLEYMADPRQATDDGWTPLRLATSKGYTAITELLSRERAPKLTASGRIKGVLLQ